MAKQNKWAIKWRMQFKSTENIGCLVNIYTDDTSFSPVADETKTGEDVPFAVENGITELTGSENPFFFEERLSRDLTDYIKYRTGYVSFITYSEDQLYDLYPNTYTSRFVTVFYGSRLIFTGYLQCQNFSNPFSAYPQQTKIPVVSPLGLLEYFNFNAQPYKQATEIVDVFNEIISNINPTNDSQAIGTGYKKIVFPKMVLINTTTGVDYLPDTEINAPFTGKISQEALCPYSDREICFDVNPDEEVYMPSSFKDFIQGFCCVFNFILHDTPDALVFTQLYYLHSNAHIYRYIDVESLTAEEIISGVYRNNSPSLVNKDVDDFFSIKDNAGIKFADMPYKKVILEIVSLNRDPEYHFNLNLNKYWTDRAGSNMVLFKNLAPNFSMIPDKTTESSPDLTTGRGCFIAERNDGTISKRIFVRCYPPTDELLGDNYFIDFTFKNPYMMNMWTASDIYGRPLVFYAKFRCLDSLTSEEKDLTVPLNIQIRQTIDGHTNYVRTTVGSDGILISEMSTHLGLFSPVTIQLGLLAPHDYQNKYITITDVKLYRKTTTAYRNGRTGGFNNYIEEKSNAGGIKNITTDYCAFERTYLSKYYINPFATASNTFQAPKHPYLLNKKNFIQVTMKATSDNDNVYDKDIYLIDWNMKNFLGGNTDNYEWRVISYSFYPRKDQYNILWSLIDNN